MIEDDTRNALEYIIKGLVLEGEGSNLKAARNYLCSGFRTSTKVEKNFDHQSKIKEEQAGLLKSFAQKNGFFFLDFPDKERYLAEGGEAKIYFGMDNKTVVKLNDAIYYSTWLDFLNSLLIHNLLFADTAYELIGFKEAETGLTAILKQPFIISDRQTDLGDVRIFLTYNGFENTRRNDYYNKELGLILEDIHDENVITGSDTLFFIDTVFYIHIT